jgi:hypothetical protein
MNCQASITFLCDQIMISDDTLRSKLVDEGITFDPIADFDEEDIQSLCASVHRPDGQVINQDGTVTRNDGVAVPYLVEKRLKLVCYAARYYKLVGRPINADCMTWALIRQFEAFIELQEEHNDPKDLPPVSKRLRILKWMEVFESYLQNTLGVAKVPLAYVTRKTIEVSPIRDNPFLPRDPKPFGSQYSSFYDEMVACTAHDLPSFAADNRTVMELLVKSFLENNPSLMSSIRLQQRRGDGRAALHAVMLHNMGNTKWDDLIEKAMNKITKGV